MAARIDSGELFLHVEFINLSEKIKEIIEQAKRSYPQRNVLASIQENVYLKIDPGRLIPLLQTSSKMHFYIRKRIKM